MWESGSMIAAVMFISAILQHVHYLHTFSRLILGEYWHKLIGYFNPYISIVFNEHQGRWNKRSKTYKAIDQYLSTFASDRARRLKSSDVKKCKNIVLSMNEYEDVIDEFKGIKIKWSSRASEPTQQIVLSSHGAAPERRRYYELTFHKKHRKIIINDYINHVIEEGKAIAKNSRHQKLYTNGGEDQYEETNSMWCDILFEHPSTFNTLAMDPQKKEKILNDLMMFKRSKDYYKKVGKTWKRGYLLYGPPGTGKSSMIAAMANLLEYDVYDLELSSVKDNMELRRLLIDTSSKSLIVIEDIDCSLDLTGKRKETKEQKSDQEAEDIITKKKDKKKQSKLTLSGLLNSVDGLWSACRSEKIIVFTTNHVDKLDPALIRRGRMDMHIELSYCCFETFKVLAKNNLDVESHELFATISQLLKETNMTPADVAENLMPKSVEDTADTCLNNLIKCLEDAKEEARLKAMKEECKKNNENDEKEQDGEEFMKKSSNKSEENVIKVQDDEELSDEELSDEESSDEESSEEESGDSDG